MQTAFDNAYTLLCTKYRNSKIIWDLTSAKRWGNASASDKQIQLIKRRGRKIISESDFDIDSLTKLQASQILDRLIG